MTKNRDNVAAQTAIRRTMLANGYVPLANAEKMCLLKGWSTMEVTEEVIESWSDSLRYQTTGLRIDAPLVAIDIDIDDAEIVDELFGWAADSWGEDWADRVLIRRRSTGGAKETWLFRVDEPFHVPPGPKFVRPGEDPQNSELDSHKVELFGGAAGRQIGAYGVHTPGKIDYVWAPDAKGGRPGPADVPVDSLPRLAKAQVFSIYAAYAELLEARGWARVLHYDPEEWSGVRTVYDIPPGLVVVGTRGSCAVEQLREGDRVRMLEIAGDGANPTRGLARETDRGIAVWDAETGVTHMLQSAEPEATQSLVARLGERLRGIMGEEAFNEAVTPTQAEIVDAVRVLDKATWALDDGVDGESWEDMARLVLNMQLRYAHFPSGSTNEEIVDMFTGTGFSVSAFTRLMSPHAMELETGEEYVSGAKSGQPKTKEINPVSRLLRDPETVRLAGYQFRPGDPARLLDTPKGTMLNLWEPPAFLGVPAEDASWFGEFMEYLIPEEADRRWVINWLAHKVQNPAERGVGLVLVTPAMGTGRNVLMKLVQHVMGKEWCGEVPAGVLTGASNQSQYDDAFLDKSLICCDEIAMVGSSFDARMKAYERLKSVVDPYPQLRSLNRKGLAPIVADVHYSALLASNHPYDALPLHPGDRRFAVIECTRRPFKDTRADIKAIVDRVLPHGGAARASAIHGLFQYLSELPTDREAFYSVPDTEVRRTMIEDREGEVEKTIRQFVAKLPPEQTVFWFSDLVRRGKDWLREHPRAMQGFEHNARKLLREGFAGWEYANKATRFVNSQGESVIAKGVVHLVDVVSTPVDRGRWLEKGGS